MQACQDYGAAHRCPLGLQHGHIYTFIEWWYVTNKAALWEGETGTKYMHMNDSGVLVWINGICCNKVLFQLTMDITGNYVSISTINNKNNEIHHISVDAQGNVSTKTTFDPAFNFQ